jgi:hypothetical protein
MNPFLSLNSYFIGPDFPCLEAAFGRREAKKSGKDPTFVIPFILQALGLCRNPPDPRKSTDFSGLCIDFCPFGSGPF